MTYRDTQITCTACGKQFIFRIEEQRRQAQRGEEATPPELCPACRTQTRAERRPKPATKSSPKPQAEQKPRTPTVLEPGPHEGSVKWYDGERGYGFIIHPSGEEIFFHRTGVAPGERPYFPDGARVTYLIEETEKGPQAVDVARMDVENSTSGE
jgi:CspA family cold shock protein